MYTTIKGNQSNNCAHCTNILSAVCVQWTWDNRYSYPKYVPPFEMPLASIDALLKASSIVDPSLRLI